MPDQLQLRGGTTTEHNSFTGAAREVTADTTKITLVVHDGSQAGGTPLMRENGGNAASSVQIGSGGVNALTIDGSQDITLTGASANVVWDKSENAFEFADSAKAVFGTGLDLNIYHNPSGAGTNYIQAISGNTIVQQQGNGAEITIGATNIRLKNHNINETYLYGVNNGAIQLYFDNVAKFQTSAEGVDIVSGNLTITDNYKARFGASLDLQIFHDGTHSHITNATNDLTISCATSDADLIVKAKKVSLKDLNNNFLLRGETDGEVKLYHSGSMKLETTSSGVQAARYSFDSDNYITCNTSANTMEFVTNSTDIGEFSPSGLMLRDNMQLKLGNGNDLKLYHNGTSSYISNTTGNLYITATSTETAIQIIPNGAVDLRHDGSKKLETRSDGVKVSGQEFITEGTIVLEKPTAHHHRILANDSGNDLGFQQSSDTGSNTNFTTYLRINDGGDISLPVDNQKLRIGASGDLELLHDGTDCLIRMEGGTGGDLIIQTGSSDDDVFVKCNDDFIVNVQGGAENAIIARNSGEVQLFFDGASQPKAQTVSAGFAVGGKLFTSRTDTGSNTDYASFKVSFFQQIAASGSHTFQVGSVYAMGTVTTFGSRGPSASNATLATGKIFPIHVRAGATAGLGSQIGSDLGGASGGFAYTVAAASQGITVTNGSSTYAINVFVSFDLTGFVT